MKFSEATTAGDSALRNFNPADVACGSIASEPGRGVTPIMSAVPPIPAVNSMRCCPIGARVAGREASFAFTRNLQISLHLSGTFQVSIFARVGHDQRCSEPDGNDARDVPSEPLLLT
jgi:hypothetical protein